MNCYCAVLRWPEFESRFVAYVITYEPFDVSGGVIKKAFPRPYQHAHRVGMGWYYELIDDCPQREKNE